MKRSLWLFFLVFVASVVGCTADTERHENIGRTSAALRTVGSISLGQSSPRTQPYVPFNLTATLTAASPRPTGSCQFVDLTNAQAPVFLGQPVSLDAQTGVCMLSGYEFTNADAFGPHTLGFQYTGDANFAPITTSPVAVNHVLTRPTLMDVELDSSHPSFSFVYGEIVPLDITVSQSVLTAASIPQSVIVPAASGTVDVFYSPSFSQEHSTDVLLNSTPCTVANGSGTCSVVANVPIGEARQLYVKFTPDPAGDYSDAATNVDYLNMNQADSSLAITKSSPFPSAVGAPVTFTVQVTPAGASTLTPTGSVQLWTDGEGDSTTIGESTPVSPSGVFTITVSDAVLTSTEGDKTVFAIYTPDSENFDGNTSQSFTHKVGKDAITPTFTADPTWTYGMPVTFTFTIPNTASGPATGSVKFHDTTDGDLLGSPVTLVANGSNMRATITASNLTFGSHSVTATYDGDGTHGNAALTITKSVGQATPQIGVTITPNSATAPVYSQSVTLVANVIGSGQIAPTGTVRFFDGAPPTNPISGNLAVGAATAFVSTLTVGGHTIYAQYSGDTRYVAGPSSKAVTIQPDPVTIAVAANTPATVSTPVSLTAHVAHSANATVTPNGQVTFFDGSAPLGTSSTDVTGDAFFNTSSLAVGVHQITASFSGGGNWTTPTSDPFPLTISASPVTSNLEVSPNPQVFGKPVVITASFGTPLAGPATGSVNFLDGTTLLATVQIAQGNAVFTTSSLTAGSHVLRVQYAGDANHAASNASVSEQITPVDSITMLTTTAPDSAEIGTAVALRAQVTLPTGTPIGVVTFKDGATTIAQTALNAAGIATFSTTALAVGSHSLTATFNGDSSSGSSTSPAVTHIVTKATPTITVVSSGNPAPLAASIFFTATLTAAPSVGFVPSGAVTFKDGTTTIGSATINPSGVATFGTTTLTAGAHSITATFAGDSHFNAAASAALAQSVSAKAASITLDSSPNPSTVGNTVTLTATLSGSAGVPTGTITFRQGSTTIGTGTLDATGKASASTTSLPIGTLTLSADYSGDGAYDASTSSIAHVVGQATTTTTLAASTSSAPVGTSLSFTATVATTSTIAVTGDVEFFDATVSLGTVTLSANIATFTTSALPAGPNVITAVYHGNDTFASSQSNSQILTVTDVASLPDAGVDSGTSSGENGSSDAGASNAADAASNAAPGTSGGLNIGAGGSGDGGDDCSMTSGATGTLTVPALFGLIALASRRRRRRRPA